MDDIVFIGNHRDATLFRGAGIQSYAPPAGLLAERVLAERGRCRVLAMTQDTLNALPAALARELREGTWPQLEIIAEPRRKGVTDSLLSALRRCRPVAGPVLA